MSGIGSVLPSAQFFWHYFFPFFSRRSFPTPELLNKVSLPKSTFNCTEKYWGFEGKRVPRSCRNFSWCLWSRQDHTWLCLKQHLLLLWPRWMSGDGVGAACEMLVPKGFAASQLSPNPPKTLLLSVGGDGRRQNNQVLFVLL